ncbi:cytoplasmic dynein 1 intermediate chain 1 [Trichonephila inaurata madagascariensis]|uniref:Cytoplasmic dynein 1 intermediate chain 1 n=1 Tax=Trichonephila inaurata madagascariensis TaxID=2747483 RepID=A0A8X6MGX8_9ARAC|nr:cytoplasmic dynein 1 intermediate chain 1 [Trichonephila inaurata madagascariensis]
MYCTVAINRCHDGMADRRAELERKRQKLALLREEKARRKREKEALKNEEAAIISFKREKDVLIETDKLLASLNVTTSIASLPNTSDSSLSDASLNKPSIQPSPPKPKKINLSVVSVHQTTVPPAEKIVYDKQSQTIHSSSDKEAASLDYYVLTYDDSSISEEGESFSLPSIDGMVHHFPNQKHHKLVGLPTVNMVKPAKTSADEDKEAEVKQKEEEEKKKPSDLSDEEKLVLMRSDNFRHFIDRSSRIIERALYQDVDIFIDYTGVQEESESDDHSGMSLSLNRCFHDDHWSKNRTVTSFDWSTQFPELLCASYNQNEDAPHQPDGICLIWNTRFKKTTPEYVFHCQFPELLCASYNQNEDAPHQPDGICLIWNTRFKKTTPEYVFHCQSPVTTACFAKYHPNLVIGGTYSGQIVLWDNRSNKRTPVQRSPLSAIAHTHPVYSICMVGSENAHNLVTISTDGKCCTWSVDMLSAPQDTIELNQQKQSRTVAVTCMAFPNDEYNNFVVGSEDGIVYSACRHDSKSGIVESFESHQGPITAISTHKSRGPIDFPDLFLTSSFDWTIKLWSLKKGQPLHSFEHNSDYVFDVSWSPIHPALFACVDGLGNLDIWNLNCDSELPTVGTLIDGSPALNRVSWTHSGQQVAVGDSLGKIWLYDVGEQLANPKADDWPKLMETLEEFQSNQSYISGDIMSPQVSHPPSPYLSSTPVR